MSDEGDEDSFDLAGIVTDQVTEQLDASELLGGGSIEDQVDTGALGAAVGREFGARVGHEFGAEIGGEIHETIAAGLDRGAELKEIAGDVKTAIREAIVRVFSRLASRETIASVADALGSEELGDQIRDAIPEEGAEALEGATEEVEKTTEGVEEATSDLLDGESEEDGEEREESDESEAEDDEDGEDEGDGDEGDDESDEDLTDKVDEATPDALGGDDETPTSEDLEGLRRETLEDFLDVMSYRDLQSVAKDVDVQANLSREEMTEEIIETVSADEE